MTGSYSDPAFQIGQELAEERDGQVVSVSRIFIKLFTTFRPYLAKLTGNQIKALISIALRIDASGEAYPSLRTIGNE